MSKKDELLNQIKELEEKNRLLQSENKMLQNTLNAFRPYDSFSQFKVKDDLFLPDTPFWNEPLDMYSKLLKAANNVGPDFMTRPAYPWETPWMVAEDSPAVEKVPEETKKKIEELEGLIDELHAKLERVSAPLAFVVEAIKKKAQFVSVAAAYELLVQMSSVFMGYEPWQENVRQLEAFLSREKARAMKQTTLLHMYPTDVEMADALSSINGKGKVLDERQKWMGVCKYVMARCGYPHDIKACCKKLARLPYKEELEFPCDYENVRKLMTCGFYFENYDNWSTYEPKKTEKKYFDACYDVAQELERKIEVS